jgi:hypothetical protein
MPDLLVAELEGAVRGQMARWLERLGRLKGAGGPEAEAEEAWAEVEVGADDLGADLGNLGDLGDMGNLELTGQYACREYRTGAVVRWHTDPADSQPLTAIVHIAHQQLHQHRHPSSISSSSSNDSSCDGAGTGAGTGAGAGVNGSGGGGGGGVCGRDWAISLPYSLHAFSGALCPYAGAGTQGTGAAGADAGVNTGAGTGASAGGVHGEENQEAPCPMTRGAGLEQIHTIYLRPGQVLLLQSAKLPHAR